MPAAAKISAQDEATILARHAAGEPLRAIAADYPISHQALSKRLKRARARPAWQRGRQPQPVGEPAGERSPASKPRPPAGPSAAAALADASPAAPRRGGGLVRLRRGREARWVDPVAASARYQQLLAEGFSTETPLA